jgi:hypothetical protein
MTESDRPIDATDRETHHVARPPKSFLGNVLLDGPDGQCAYIYPGIGERCTSEPDAHTFVERGGEMKVVEMCAEHAREEVPTNEREQAQIVTDGGQIEDGTEHRIVHLFADTGVEDEVLHTFGDVVRIGIDPEPNPFSTVVQADARNPPLSRGFDLAVAHPRCQRFSKATAGGGTDPDDHPNQIPAARSACQRLADHYIIENVPQAPLRDPVKLTGGMFGMGIHYARAFETSFHVPQPDTAVRFRPEDGPLAEQGKDGNAWVGKTDGWRLAKGYSYDWPGRGLKRHAVPAPYLRRLLYWWLAAVEDGTRSEQVSIKEAVADGGQRSVDTATEQSGTADSS